MMCPLMQSEDKLLPLKEKPNQTWSVIAVAVMLGFSGERLTSGKTSARSHPRTLCVHAFINTRRPVVHRIREFKKRVLSAALKSIVIRKKRIHIGLSINPKIASEIPAILYDLYYLIIAENYRINN